MCLGKVMNYRHVFHAGNFADLAKHAILSRLLSDLTASPGPLTVIDTHAGAGLYDLDDSAARRTGEADAGVGRLLRAPDAPASLAPIRTAVQKVNPEGGGRFYPGSPLFIAAALRPADRYVACELRPDDFEALTRNLAGTHAAELHGGDGWKYAAQIAPKAPARLLVLIDPPFEQGDDYAQSVDLAGRIVETNPAAVVAIWLPIKDLNTFDVFLGDLEDAIGETPLLVAEVRLRPLDDPMRLNGCALVVTNPPPGLTKASAETVAWIARKLGEAGGLGRATLLGSPT
jgi:23S rRNA (adenine2030-N6)-methyltransferase